MKQKSLRKKVFWNAGVKRMLMGAAAIHYTTQGEQEAVESSLRLNHGVVVPLGVDAPKRPGTETVAKLAVRFPALLDHPYVLVLSRLHPKKALEVLIEAFVSLMKRQEFRSWRLVLAGEGPAEYVSSLKRIVDEHNASEFVIFPGWLEGDDKEVALGNASLLALPSHHENFGLCVMEALAAGIPVLISPHVNLAEEVEAAQAGWIADVNKADIEAKLSEALGDQEERSKRSQAGKELSHNFLWESVASQLKEMYSAVMRTRHQSDRTRNAANTERSS
jgi:glycosyltransferase involved in cell wall biosynthesis